MIISPSLIPLEKGFPAFLVAYADKVPAEVLALGSAAVPDAGIRRLWWAASSPTPFSTASGVPGLIAGPSSALRSLNFE
jgi:hypothetical protein